MNNRRIVRPAVGEPSQHSGFTLIEVLVALIILAIGVMGVAALQVSTYQQLQTSHNFATAALLAGDMADRMMGNSAQVLANAYNHTDAEGKPKNCADNTCTAAEIAAYDVDEWQTKVTGGIDDGDKIPGALPSGVGSVVRLAGGPPSNFQVIVRWDDDLSGSTGTGCLALDPTTVPDPDNLDCYVVTIMF